MRSLQAAVIALAVLVPARGFCQSNAGVLPRFDVSASIGSFSANKELSERSTEWSQTLFTGAAIGYYWTPHVKSELEIASGGTAELNGFREIQLVPGANESYVYTRNRYRVIKLSIGQTYQFGRNEWVHPFVGVGVDLDNERADIEQPAQRAYVFVGGRSSEIALPATEDTSRSVRAQAFVKGGAKAYVSPKTFVIGDVTLGVTTSVHQTILKIGMGIDF